MGLENKKNVILGKLIFFSLPVFAWSSATPLWKTRTFCKLFNTFLLCLSKSLRSDLFPVAKEFYRKISFGGSFFQHFFLWHDLFFLHLIQHPLYSTFFLFVNTLDYPQQLSHQQALVEWRFDRTIFLTVLINFVWVPWPQSHVSERFSQNITFKSIRLRLIKQTREQGCFIFNCSLGRRPKFKFFVC